MHLSVAREDFDREAPCLAQAAHSASKLGVGGRHRGVPRPARAARPSSCGSGDLADDLDHPPRRSGREHEPVGGLVDETSVEEAAQGVLNTGVVFKGPAMSSTDQIGRSSPVRRYSASRSIASNRSTGSGVGFSSGIWGVHAP